MTEREPNTDHAGGLHVITCIDVNPRPGVPPNIIELDDIKPFDKTLEEQIAEEALNNNTVYWFSSFKIIRGVVSVEGVESAVTSKRRDQTGKTFIDGIVCPAKFEEIEALITEKTGEPLSVKQRARAEMFETYAKYSLDEDLVVLVGPVQDIIIEPFKRSEDKILRRSSGMTWGVN